MAPFTIACAVFSVANAADFDEYAMLQMPVVAADEDECRCPGYYEEQCTAEAAQGCVWSDQGSSNKPWCQCLGVRQDVVVNPVTVPPLPVIVTLPPQPEPPLAYDCETCRELATSMGLEIGGAGYAFTGDYGVNGCYTYTSGAYGCRAYCVNGATVAEAAEQLSSTDLGNGRVRLSDPEVSGQCSPPVTLPPAPVTAAPEPASCPSDWLQVGESGADIGGCGLQPCDQRYQTTSEGGCALACNAMAGCQGFSYSPLRGDRNHETERVCTLYNSDTPTDTWSGSAGFVQVFCTRVSPPVVPEPPVALIPECDSGGFLIGDGTGAGAHETYIGTASSPEVCVAMVHDQCPSANGATLPTSGDGGCYCEFAMTGVNSNSHWSSCQFAVPVAEPEPPVNTFSQCDGGSFLTGDGVGGHETNIGTAASAEECVAMVREQCPEANGATLPTSGSGGCYCEFGMTGVNTSPSWQSCNFLAPPEESPPPTTSIPECVGGTFLTGDGAGGHETNIGAASSPQECVAMVLEQCPGANGATLPAGGDGNCYCEFSMSSLNGNTHWQSCQFEEAARTLIDECNGGAYLIGDGTGGHETHIGSAATPEECVTMVHQQCPGANGATLPTSGSGGCYCEYGMTDVNSNQHWSSCHFAVPVVEPDQTQCAPPVDSTADAGYNDDYRGWYDVQGCGECNDYCRWVGNTGSLGDPSANFHLGQDGAGNPSWWSCRLAGTTDTYSARGLFTSFDFQKCAGQR